MNANILYVDDSVTKLNEFELKFSSNFNIYTSSSIEKAIDILWSHTISLVIINSKYNIDSFAFVKSIKKHFNNIFIILFGEEVSKSEIIKSLNENYIDLYAEDLWDKNLENLIVQTINKIDERKKTTNHDIVQNLQSMLNELELLHKISQKLSQKRDLPVLLEEIIGSSKSMMRAEASSLLLYNAKEKKLFFDVVIGDNKKTINKMEVSLGEGIAGWVAEKKESLLIEDCYKDDRFNPEMDIKTNFKTKSMICVPMLRQGRLIGVIQVINKKAGLLFNEVDLNLFKTLASQCAIAIENAQLVEEQIENGKITYELKMAHGIQMNLLPSAIPNYSDLDISATLIPAKDVGGDYYNIIKLDEEFSLFVIADVSGKGIPAALIVSVIYSSLITQIKQSGSKINLLILVETLNKVLIEATTNDRFVTAWVGIYEHSTKILKGVNAGHNYPYLIRNKLEKPIELTKGGIMLGSMELPFEDEEIILVSGDVLCLFTDGITEAWNNLEEEYGEERLIHLLNSHSKLTSKEILSELLKDVQLHVGKAVPSDDITCIVMKVQ